MAKSLKGTRTERNLLTAFAGESQARNRYTYAAGQARKDGYVQIAAVFEETANQEKERAKRFFSFLEGGDVLPNVDASFPAFGLPKTLTDHLKFAHLGEAHEWGTLYPSFAKIAREEGFDMVAKAFESIAIAEKQHEKRYKDLLHNLETGHVFKKDQKTTWQCKNCGYTHEGTEALQACPACLHPQAYFEVLAENW